MTSSRVVYPHVYRHVYEGVYVQVYGPLSLTGGGIQRNELLTESAPAGIISTAMHEACGGSPRRPWFC
ncbi:hypothetical protein CBM2633_B40006 [Cupriavidus taiwanensis]|nr:hypothetical protein CBM2604_B30005 [Cupriavidus taiwanensis]SOZ32140.1 hypothetical protein CBM2609_B20006 [Cupriavidus taiwanensis]SOZ47745.1 hypothetical protein CBM2610_B20005 [Cupriavidus taiwanensis]SPA21879.1 hypothetical protein CBM2633_B40006 [Cupriavidus taiwanensis]